MKSILQVSANIIKAKMTPSSLAILIFVIYASNLPTSTDAQYNSNYKCDKYCHQSCSEYFPGSEFGDCVTANVHCSCHTKITAKNPLLIFVLVAGLFVVLFCCGLGYRICKINSIGRPPPPRAVAHPVPVAVVGAVITNNRRSSNGNANNTSQSQRNLRGYVNPLGPQKSNDIPPEYLPPPAYNECVIDMNQQEKTEKTLT